MCTWHAASAAGCAPEACRGDPALDGCTRCGLAVATAHCRRRPGRPLLKPRTGSGSTSAATAASTATASPTAFTAFAGLTFGLAGAAAPAEAAIAAAAIAAVFFFLSVPPTAAPAAAAAAAAAAFSFLAGTAAAVAAPAAPQSFSCGNALVMSVSFGCLLSQWARSIGSLATFEKVCLQRRQIWPVAAASHFLRSAARSSAVLAVLPAFFSCDCTFCRPRAMVQRLVDVRRRRWRRARVGRPAVSGKLNRCGIAGAFSLFTPCLCSPGVFIPRL